MISEHRRETWKKKFKWKLEAFIVFVTYYLFMEFVFKPAISHVDILVRFVNHGQNGRIIWFVLFFATLYFYYHIQREWRDGKYLLFFK